MVALVSAGANGVEPMGRIVAIPIERVGEVIHRVHEIGTTVST